MNMDVAAIRRVRCVVFDLHGVLVRGDDLVSGAASSLDRINDLGIPIAIFTNTSAKTVTAIRQTLGALGLRTGDLVIITAATLLGAKLVADDQSHHQVVRIGGGSALEEELDVVGVRSISLSDASLLTDSSITFSVVIGHTTDFGIADAGQVLAIASRVKSCYAAERDRWYASKDGISLVWPGSLARWRRCWTGGRW